MDYTLRELLDVPRLQALLDSLNRMVLFPSAIMDLENNILTASGWQDVCRRFHREHPETLSDCHHSDQFILSRVREANPSVTYVCPRGLVDSATPIYIDGQHVGNVFTGQVLLEKPDMEFFKAQARKFGFDEKAYLEAVARVPVVTREQLDNMLGVVRDFAELLGEMALRGKRAAEAKHKAALLAESTRLKDIFTDVLRHDILTPVQTIHLGAQILLKGEADPQKANVLQGIERGVASLQEMAQNAAEYARLTAMETPGVAPVDLRQCLETVIGDCELLLKEKELRAVVAPGGPAPAVVSPMIKDVFANLLSNAIKYSPPRGAIEVGIEKEAEGWRIAVKDRGEGIRDEDKERVFNRFERLDRQSVKGSGLGLAIAKQIVTMHRGMIWIEDNPGGGSIFCVRLPKDPVPAMVQASVGAASRG